MALDLSSYASIQSNLFVRIDLSYTSEVLLFSDTRDTVAINDEEYTGLGQLMGVTATSSDLKSTANEVSITISGIPNASIAEILNSRIKGSKVKIWRCIFDPVTRLPLAIAGNPAGRFTGFVSNYSLNEEFDASQRTATNTITIICSGLMDVLSNTSKGRRTNPEDQKFWFPTDVSMDRIPGLVGAYWNFGESQ